MILRIFEATIHPDRVAEFDRFFRETALPLVRAQPGLVSVTAGTPRPDAPPVYCMAMVWRDIDALRAFAGPDWQRPHVAPEEAGLVTDRRLAHYTLCREPAPATEFDDA